MLSSVDGGDDYHNSDSDMDDLEGDMDGDYLEDLSDQNLKNQLFSDFNIGANSSNSKEGE